MRSYPMFMSLRKRRGYLLTLLIAAAALFSSCSDGQEEPFVQETFAMGTKAMVRIYGMDDEKARTAASAGLHEIHRIEAAMSNWRDDSELSMLNASAGSGPVRISSELFGLLERCSNYCRITQGAFDVTAMPLVRLWGFRGGEPKMPGREDIDAALRKVGCGLVLLSAEDTTASLPEGVEIDLAGVGKGYAVDRCAEMLAAHGVTSGLVNLGGNMYAIGRPPGRSGWSIGIRDPSGGLDIAGELLISDAAVSTSGDYENFVVIDGKRYGHIIDPRTGMTADKVLSVTVIASGAEVADAMSTGLFVLGYEGSAVVRTAIPGLRALFALDEDSWKTLGDFSGILDMP